MVTADDIATSMGTLLSGSAAFVSAVPGGAWNTEGPDAPESYPYAVFKVEGNGPLWNSGPVYTQVWRFSVAAYAPVGASGVSQIAVQQAMWTALCRQQGSATMRSPGPATQAVLCILPSTNQAKYDPRRRNGRDVFVAGYTFDVTVQGDSSVP